MVFCSWSLAGHMIWSAAQQACYNYVHHLKSERNFRDTLTIPTSKLHSTEVVWHKKHEINYHGRMFDIKRALQDGERTILIGHYDDFEHELYKLLAKLFNSGSDAPAHQEVPSWLTIVAIIPSFDKSATVNTHDKRYHHSKWKNKFHYSISNSPLYSPPDILS